MTTTSVLDTTRGAFGGHFPQLEQPLRTTEAVLGWLTHAHARARPY